MATKLITLIIFLTFIISGCGQNNAKYSDTRFAMDTFIKIDAYGNSDDALRQASDKAFAVFQRIAAETSRFNDGGAGSLWQVNHAAAGKEVKTAPYLSQILAFCTAKNNPEVDITLGAVSDLWLQGKETGTVPDSTAIKSALADSGRTNFTYNAKTQTAVRHNSGTIIDLGAVAKGFAVDAAADTLAADKNVSAALVNGGGNIKTVGQKPDGKPWIIAVQHPRRSGQFLGTLELKAGQSAATSGDYQRYYEAQGRRWHHLLSPQTGYPADFNQSVTVITASAAEADYNSTLLFFKPLPEIKNYLKAHPELNAIVVTNSGSLWVSPGLKNIWHELPQE